MSKGFWLRNLFLKMIKNQISIQDSAKLFSARFRKKPLHLKVLGLEFSEIDHVVWSIVMDIFVNEIYTPNGFEIQPDDVIVDIGAHQGVFSAYAAQRTRGTIKSYEPNSVNFKKLCGFISRNNLANVDPHHKAIAGSSGEGKLYLSGTTSTHFLINATDISDLEGQTFETIQTESLDLLLKDMDHVDLLKLDCEGAEIDILLSANRESLKKIKRISAEIHYCLDNPALKEMIEKLATIYPLIEVKKASGINLGYLYAR